MKKIMIALISLLVVSVVFLSGCNTQTGVKKEDYSDESTIFEEEEDEKDTSSDENDETDKVYYFGISGKIINNYHENVDVDYLLAEEYNNWNYFPPTVSISPYTETGFGCSAEGGYSSYLIFAQWFYPYSDEEGCEMVQYKFSNPSGEDLAIYIEIKKDGDIEISENYNPPIQPKTPEIISQNIYTFDGNTCIVGKIKNVDSLSIKYVNIKVSLYDSGNNVIEEHLAYPLMGLIGPQKTSSFYIKFYNQDYYDHYDVKISSFETTDEEAYNDIKILNHKMEDVGSYYPNKEVTGTIKNTGSSIVDSLEVYAFFKDSKGNMLITKYDYIGTLFAGEEESFEITLYHFTELEELPRSISIYNLEIGYDV